MFVALHEIGMRICLADCTIKEDIHAETLAVLNEKNKKKKNKKNPVKVIIVVWDKLWV